MHISNTLKATIVAGTLAVGGAVVGIATAAAAPSSTSTSPTPTTSATPTTPATPSTKSTTPSTKTPCPNMGSGSGAKGGSYAGPPPGSAAPAGYAGAGPEVSYQ